MDDLYIESFSSQATEEKEDPIMPPVAISTPFGMRKCLQLLRDEIGKKFKDCIPLISLIEKIEAEIDRENNEIVISLIEQLEEFLDLYFFVPTARNKHANSS